DLQVHVGARLAEADHLRPLELAADRGLHADRVHLRAAADDLVMQMRAGGAAGRADITDDLALTHARAGAHRGDDAAHMRIGRSELGVVADADVIAVGAVPAGLLDHAIARSLDRRAGGRTEIDAFVHGAIAQDRMIARAEAGGEARPVDR